MTTIHAFLFYLSCLPCLSTPSLNSITRTDHLEPYAREDIEPNQGKSGPVPQRRAIVALLD